MRESLLMNSPLPYAVVVVAAGNSSRLGSPKQLLSYKGTNLLTNLILEIKKVDFVQTTIVLGAYAEQILSEIPTHEVNIVQNLNWEQGLGTSISTGIASLNITPDLLGCILMVCDQPYISDQLLINLINTQLSSKKGIVASRYNGIVGTPVLFSQKYFSNLLNLPPDQGAKKLLSQFQDDMAYVNFEEGIYDIDTPEDYRLLRQ